MISTHFTRCGPRLLLLLTYIGVAAVHQGLDDRKTTMSGGTRSSQEEDERASLLSDVVSEIVERDRQWMHREVVRVLSFTWGVLSALCAGSITAFSLYGPLLLTRLHYSQYRVNAVAVAAEIATYLPVPIFGYLCDRYTPALVSLLSAFLFGAGYLFAALAYRSGPPADAGGHGWSYAVMVVSFLGVGAGTASMYLSAVTTCAKNFGRSKYKGIMLAMPIAAFGLSGMWQSQIGRHLLYERLPDGRKGDVDVFKYFAFLAILLFVVGIGGFFALKIVDQDAMINEAVEELERSGYLEESDFFRSREEVDASGTFSYGTFASNEDTNGGLEEQANAADEEQLPLPEEAENEKKTWLLNHETRIFLRDQTMWYLAAGFFLVTGPGEAYINNVGTVLHTLTPRSYPSDAPPPAGQPSTHVTTIALTSTVARLLAGSLSDIFSPTSSSSHPQPQHYEPEPEPGLESRSRAGLRARPSSQRRGFTLSRLAILLPSALLLSLGYLLLTTPLPLAHPSAFHATTALVGFGYGASFSLAPLIISVVWGVENFGTNWGIVAMAPAVGAAVWGSVYSSAYEAALKRQQAGNGDDDDGGGDEQCFGWRCYGFWALGCTLSVWVAVCSWAVAWRQWRKKGVVV